MNKKNIKKETICMKKLFSFLSLFFVLFYFCSCSNSQQSSASATNKIITSKICEIDGFENFSKETIKALAVTFRTNIKNGEKYNYHKECFDESVFSLVDETKDEIIEDINSTILFDNNNSWKQEIPKSKILETFSLKGKNISSFENIFLNKDSCGRVNSLLVSNKTLLQKELKDQLGLKSNNIINIETSTTSIIFYGIGDSFGEKFDILLSEKLAKDNKGYEDIINYLKNSYKTIK